MSIDKEGEKRLSAEAAIEFIEDGMVVGVGTGSTVAYFIEALGRNRAPAVAIVAGGRLAGYVTAENLGEMLLLRGAGGPLPRPDQRQAREHP